ncbi:MAG: hypothetical protein GF346_02085, partial [Candidatus Eisenbacteria bacterium]|nr:hypothetical protein [Candidatus Latescibacterota bacterium]MBD3301221.1 hypothetical protein [Candidatus Eisenbacteria bacterium]
MRVALSSAACLICAALAAGAQPFPNVRVDSESNSPEETSIGINPADPENLVGAAQTPPCRYYVSSDGGGIWSEGTLPDPYDLGDPAVVFDREGNVYYSYIGIWSHSGIFVNRSTDGGTTWWPAGTAIVEHDGAVPFEDKSYLVADWSGGPHHGSLYVGWTRFTDYGSGAPEDSTWIYIARSRDRAVTFSEPLRISDRGGDAVDSDDTVEGAVPAVGPDSRVYVAWSGPRGIEFDRSEDGGDRFG